MQLLLSNLKPLRMNAQIERVEIAERQWKFHSENLSRPDIDHLWKGKITRTSDGVIGLLRNPKGKHQVLLSCSFMIFLKRSSVIFR